MSGSVNWIELHHHPLWRALWNSPEIERKESALRERLLGGNVTDPHELGLLRGQLKALAELRGNVELLANEAQKRISGESESGIKDDEGGGEPPVHWARRALGRVMR